MGDGNNLGNANLSLVVIGKDQTVGLYHVLDFWLAEAGGEGSHAGGVKGMGQFSPHPLRM